jgi:hypothetical protein
MTQVLVRVLDAALTQVTQLLVLGTVVGHGRGHVGLEQVDLLLVREYLVLVLPHLEHLTLHLALGAAKAPKHAAAPATRTPNVSNQQLERSAAVTPSSVAPTGNLEHDQTKDSASCANMKPLRLYQRPNLVTPCPPSLHQPNIPPT